MPGVGQKGQGVRKQTHNQFDDEIDAVEDQGNPKGTFGQMGRVVMMRVSVPVMIVTGMFRLRHGLILARGARLSI